MRGRRRGKAGETREKVLAFVRQRLLEGAPPTVREVQRALGFRAVQTAQQHLGALVGDGRLAKEEGLSRGYRLTAEAPRPMMVPLLGRVQAGALTVAVEAHEGYLPVEPRRPATAPGAAGRAAAELFALRVRGDSMVGAGILAGDVVVVRRQRTASSGDIVVALVGDEATVKRLHLPRGGRPRVELRAENPAFPPIVIEPPDEPMLLGRVIEVRRYLDAVRK